MNFSNIITNIDDFKNAIDNGFKEHYSDDYYGAKTETLKKYKEKAELNLSVTKLNSEEIEGFIDPEQNKIYFSLDNTKYGIQPGDHIYVSEELQEVPSISTTNGRRKI